MPRVESQPDSVYQNIMHRALALAQRGQGYVEPNPMVGAIILDGQQVIGEGYHQRFGGPHAEVNALHDCRARGHDPAGKTMVVTLEPCAHHGKTPPCAQALIEARLARVVVAMTDPFGQVAGRGLARLRDAGIAVEVGVEEAAARRLNEPFIKHVTTGLPWVIVKWAQTLDGRIATAIGDSRWISNDASRRFVHQTRARVDAIITGVGTVLADDPALTARGVEVRREARRVIVGPREVLPADAKLLAGDGPPVLIHEDADDLRGLLQVLGREHLATNVLVEAGGGLVGRLFDQGLVDQVHAFIAPKLLGDAAAQGPLRGRQAPNLHDAHTLELVDLRRFGAGDVMLDYRVREESGKTEKRKNGK